MTDATDPGPLAEAEAEAMAADLAAIGQARALAACVYPAGRRGADWQAAVARVCPPLARAGACEAAGRALMGHGLWREAEACLRAALTRHGERAPLLRALAQVLRMTGSAQDGRSTRGRALAAEAAALGLAGAAHAAATDFMLAAEGVGPVPDAAPAALVSRHFDLYADFDEHLLERLHYRGHLLLAEAIARASPARCELRILDLGCGTGLLGQAAQARAAWLGGVDLAAEMVERARARAIYHQLAVGDAIAALAGGSEPLDVVAAAELCPYLGDLAPLLAGARARLGPGGIVALTCEAGPAGSAWTLSGSRRYRHASDYLRATLERHGFAIAELSQAPLRQEKGQPAMGFVAVGRAA